MNTTPSSRSAALDNLRSFITLLVITHHAVLAYFPYAPEPGAFDVWLVWGGFPIIDAARGKGLDLLVLWNDSFFMALMFLLSGLFVGPSLARKGAGRFVRDRLLRLGLPFVVGAAVLAPLAYYPAYLQRAAATEAESFWAAWLALGRWPAGPVWFLWVLLVFGVLAALVQRFAPRALERLGALGVWCRERPLRGFGVLLGLGVASYLPLTWVYDPAHWLSWGPFFVQSSRMGFYLAYFVFGIALGQRGGLGRDLAAADGRLARQWGWWQGGLWLAFGLFVTALIFSLLRLEKGEPSVFWNNAAAVLMTVSCATTSYCLLSYFAKKRSGANRWWTSLSRNAFGMYVIHYAVVTWLQYCLLEVVWPGLLKALVVTVSAIAVSWILAAGLRRLPGVGRIL
ncbi:acyltransferase [Actomonas aquatica]|uniref:Acyltransferase n=1 Tax=Actomonas aquatica TaxID=2866162 RepID=A0ABZ1CCW4_9BACT|nr:acyltransferase [Opitutus sp. WL0086]WRQ89500.1 acyltransferase [Opitutus sp. WL0086]